MDHPALWGQNIRAGRKRQKTAAILRRQRHAVIRDRQIKTLRRLMGDVQVVSNDGSKHLIKHLADGQAVIDAIEAAKSTRAQA